MPAALGTVCGDMLKPWALLILLEARPVRAREGEGFSWQNEKVAINHRHIEHTWSIAGISYY
jgi:hypothetical protein